MKSGSKLLWGTLAGSLVMFFFSFLCVSNFVRSGPGKTNHIINNLRQLEGAAQAWALEHGRTGAVQVTWQDVAPYLRPSPGENGSALSVAGEHYVLKPLTQTPEAVLTREVEGHPKGTVIRFTTNGDLEMIQPPAWAERRTE